MKSDGKLRTRLRLRCCPAFVLGCLACVLPLHSFAQQAKDSKDNPPSLVVNVNRVLIPVVVRDRQGQTVGDLKKEDFQVLEKGKPQTISGFTIEKRGGNATSTETSAAGGQQPEAAAIPGSAPAPAAPAPQRFIVFLFDDVHLSVGDMARAQKAGAQMLGEAVSDTDVAAVVSLSGQANSGLIRDRARLQDAIMTLKRHPGFQADVGDCPKLDYYQAYRIDNHDATAMQEAVQQVLLCYPPKAITPSEAEISVAEMLVTSAVHRELANGGLDILATYAAIADFVHRMANLPGQRTMILVSPGFISISSEALAAESQIMELAAQSNVTISALDARGLYTTNVGASEDLRGRNPATVTNFRGSAMALSADPLAALAQATGGTFFHNSNDLGAGFKKLTEAPETLYVLELPLDNVKPDGNFHPLKVTVDRPGMQIQARPGYFMAKAAKIKK